MYKMLIIFLVIVLLPGCGIFNLTNFIMPDDLEFIAVVESLDTPEKACQYTMENFEWEFHVLNYSPYQMWIANTKTNTGDCNDISSFLAFVAHYHGYEVYQIIIQFKGTLIGHVLCVFVENEQYTYSSNQYYYPIYVNTFRKIVEDYFVHQTLFEFYNYKVYNYDGNIVEKGN